MARRTDLTPVVDGLLRLVFVGGMVATTLLAPNAVRLLDKPLQGYFKGLDERARQREIKRILSYMKRQGVVTEDYDHGLHISKKARKRLEQANLEALRISIPHKWDKQWRIIFYDIPEKHKSGRDRLAWRLRQLGCQQLQRSVWIHPFPCEDQINTVALAHGVESYVTYLESQHINNERALLKRFSHLI